jgi:hypothetical protein
MCLASRLPPLPSNAWIRDGRKHDERREIVQEEKEGFLVGTREERGSRNGDLYDWNIVEFDASLLG